MTMLDKRYINQIQRPNPNTRSPLIKPIHFDVKGEWPKQRPKYQHDYQHGTVIRLLNGLDLLDKRDLKRLKKLQQERREQMLLELLNKQWQNSHQKL